MDGWMDGKLTPLVCKSKAFSVDKKGCVLSAYIPSPIQGIMSQL